MFQILALLNYYGCCELMTGTIITTQFITPVLMVVKPLDLIFCSYPLKSSNFLVG